MSNRGIRIEKPIGVIAPAHIAVKPDEGASLGWTFRGLLVVTYLLAITSIVVVYLAT